jgi:elongation factor Ts
MESAVDWLRTKGLAKAAKKAGRVAAEGLIGVAAEGSRAVLVEVNSETDFVARNAQFQAIVAGAAKAALGTNGSVEAVGAAPFPGSSRTVDGEIKEAVGTIGENLTLRRSAKLEVGKGVVATYVHAAVAPGLGKIGVLVALESTGDTAALSSLGRQVAMHIAAANPIAVEQSQIDPALIERERAVYREQAKESGKPDAVVDKMVEGRLRKYFEEVVLTSQAFVIDPDKTVGAAVKEFEKTAGAPIRIPAFTIFRLGEGVERAESDFAAEVAAAAGQK